MATDNDKSNLAVNAARASKDLISTAFETAKSSKNIVGTVVEAAKDFFNELIYPNMTIEKIAEIAAPRLDDLIEKNEANGLKYSAGKFKIEHVDDEHFALAFEMYFKDAEGKWYKSGGNSDPREAKLLDAGSWKTLQTLKAVEFPINAPSKEKAEAIDVTDQVAVIEPADEVQQAEPSTKPAKTDIDLEDLLSAKKNADHKINFDKD